MLAENWLPWLSSFCPWPWKVVQFYKIIEYPRRKTLRLIVLWINNCECQYFGGTKWAGSHSQNHVACEYLSFHLAVSISLVVECNVIETVGTWLISVKLAMSIMPLLGTLWLSKDQYDGVENLSYIRTAWCGALLVSLSYSTGQELSCLLWNPMIYHHVHVNQLLTPVLSYMTPVLSVT